LAEQTFDTLVIRAVAPLPKLLTWFRPHVTQFGRMLIVKGASWVAERAAARQRRLLVGLHLRLADAYATPTESGNAQSVILWITPEHG
jgi:16S rRNA (guanine527-N7)-methyltransferase